MLCCICLFVCLFSIVADDAMMQAIVHSATIVLIIFDETFFHANMRHTLQLLQKHVQCNC